MITLKDIANGQKAIVESRYADDRFVGDYEPIEFNRQDYDSMYKVTTDSMQDKLIEKVLCVKDLDTFLITATTTVFAGEQQINFISQQLSLRGFNSFSKDLDKDMSWYYDMYLQDKGYDLLLEDIQELGEFKPEFSDSTILQFKDSEDNFHTLTVNKFGQLSKITVKQSARKVNSNSSIQSAFD